MAELTWHGHACFRLRGRDAVILMDPVGRHLGSDISRLRPDIVTISHRHPGHSNVEALKGTFTILDGPGEYEIKDVFITGVRTYHDSEGGKRLGRNTVYLLESEGMVLAHLGDLGHALTAEQAELMSNVDILLVPVGGGRSLGPEQAAEVIAQLEPAIVVPMHYRTSPSQDGLEDVSHFCKEMGLTEWEALDRLSVRKSDLSETLEVKVLAPRSA